MIVTPLIVYNRIPTFMYYYLKVLFAIVLISTTINVVSAQRTTTTDFFLAYSLGAYNRAASLGEELLLRKSINENLDVWFPLSIKLGIAYHHLGDYNRGLDRLDLSINWAIEEGEYSPKDLLLAYNEKGQILLELESLTRAKITFLKAVELFEQKSLMMRDSSSKASYINALMGVGQIYYMKQQYPKAKEYIEKSLKITTENSFNDMALIAQKHLCLGMIEEKLGKSSAAADHMYIAIKMGQQEKLKQNVVWAVFYKGLAGYYWEYERRKEALEYNALALESLLPIWKGKEENQLPKIEELNHASSLAMAAQVLAQRGDFVYGMTKEIKTLEFALDHYRLLDKFVARLRRLYTGKSARLLWSDRALDFYEKAIEVCLLLNEKTGKEQYKNEAFQLSERSKSLLLLEAFKKIKAKKIANIPAEELVKEERLEEEMDEAQSELDMIKRSLYKRADYKEKLRKLEKILLKKKRAYEDFLIGLRKQYPKYYKLKYDLQVVDVKGVQSRLAADQMMIEYFIGKEELYIFKLTQNTYDIIQVPLSYNIGETIKEFRDGIYGYYTNHTKRDKALYSKYTTQYTKLGHKLYKTLLEPVLKDARENRLMIILAGNLGFLPFEALLTEGFQGNDYKKMPYVLNDYAIGYCYSATLLYEMQIKAHKPDKIFLGFSPEFKKNVTLEGKYNFSPLEHSREEVKEVFDLVGMMGVIFDGVAATKQNFQENCEDYCIVHIATHGVMNLENSENSFLAFSEVPDSNDNELLYVRDLYNMHLTASLVVLSACETGVGELYASEGIASLARGFSYAGAKSLITSLWAVNDYATAEIMKKLYENLKKGMTKDVALRQAKYDFIQSADDFAAHPFLWSAFIQIGDEAPLPSPDKKEPTSPYIFWIAIAMIGLMGGGGGLFVWSSMPKDKR